MADQLVESRRSEDILRQENQELRTFLKNCQRELTNAQSFFCSPGSIAENDIVQAVHALNAEIYQAVKRLAEECHLGSRRSDTKARQRITAIVEPRVTELLQNFPPQNDDRVVLEVALLATVMVYVAEMISLWTADRSVNEVVDAMYRSIVESEPIIVATHWRALARKHSMLNQATAEEQEREHVQGMLKHVSAVMEVARVKSWNEKDLHECLHIIARAGLALRRTVGEDVVASEYQVFAAQPDESFAPEVMVDQYAPNKRLQRTGVRVMCTLRLGLRRREREARGESKGRVEVKILIKPQVVLETIVQDLDLAEMKGERKGTKV
ncbi:hypothetical protein DAEQUDRAFT_765271 [Daedalea quercina L-15889]|uniref:Uncharacterized protein n=1 Tax=Daedalea quercina L-15889 TaxID=1314783 RepID=A0A165QMU9_9APHY|nr:hypothetical protein DAEQUDRAFT_765271 [Daedalea quercina L-15889]